MGTEVKDRQATSMMPSPVTLATSQPQQSSVIVTKKEKNGKFYTKIVPRDNLEKESCGSGKTVAKKLSYSEKVKYGAVHLSPLRKEVLVRSSSSPVQKLKKAEIEQKLTRSKSGDVHRITYDRNFLLTLRTSPLASSPPKNLPEIPGATVPYVKKSKKRLLEKTLSNMSGVSLTSVTSEDTIPEIEVDSICQLAAVNLNDK